MKKAALIVIVIVAVIAIFGTLRNQASQEEARQDSAPTTEQSQGQNTVLHTEEGFSPQTLTVDVGTSVTFKNQSGTPMWVGSDPHPLHTGFPEFDQKAEGDTYTFTFNVPGEYPYHNHLNPRNVGTIIVK